VVATVRVYRRLDASQQRRELTSQRRLHGLPHQLLDVRLEGHETGSGALTINESTDTSRASARRCAALSEGLACPSSIWESIGCDTDASSASCSCVNPLARRSSLRRRLFIDNDDTAMCIDCQYCNR